MENIDIISVINH